MVTACALGAGEGGLYLDVVVGSDGLADQWFANTQGNKRVPLRVLEWDTAGNLIAELQTFDNNHWQGSPPGRLRAADIEVQALGQIVRWSDGSPRAERAPCEVDGWQQWLNLPPA